ncbi:replication initiation protein [Sporolactobacillus sp. CPB3-1]|uniref:Replication initiation protein n=1 Tax=Sporolactobacillus mangiferae TaxID=2940498 RepID=A0ABT0MD29_9BACL|nr:replication initiation protein [Sporolactobacillus mangiferae]MCL1632784.1 replication initiation protein [Sporolactobacillus mangiferae]
MCESKKNKSDKVVLKPIKDRINWSSRARRLFKETHQHIGGLEENQLLFYLIKHCMIQTDHPYTRFSPQDVASFSADLPSDPTLLKGVLRKISNHTFWLMLPDDSECEVLTGWIHRAVYDKHQNKFIVELSPALYPYITSLHEYFRKEDYSVFEEAVHLKSKYSARLYEMFRIHEKTDELTLTLEQMRYLMGIEGDKLNRWIDLKRRAIDPAVDEINQIGKYKITYETLKSGRAIVKVSFRIRLL